MDIKKTVLNWLLTVIHVHVLKAEHKGFWLGIFLIKNLTLWLLGEKPPLAAYDVVKQTTYPNWDFNYPCSMTPAASYEAGYLHISPWTRSWNNHMCDNKYISQWLYIIPISSVGAWPFYKFIKHKWKDHPLRLQHFYFIRPFWAHLCLCTVGSYASLSVRLSVRCHLTKTHD